MSERPRIVLGEDDFAAETAPAPAPPAPSPPAQPSAAAPRSGALPRVAQSPRTPVGSGVPPKGTAPATLVNNPKTAPLIAAAVGMALAWGVAELVAVPEVDFTTSQSDIRRDTGVWTGVVAIVFVGVLLGFDRAVHGGWEAAARRFAAAAVPAFVIGFASGFLAQVVFTELLEDGQATSYSDFDF